jgi:antitoxin component YwqK of YwqJK toxin-antitoxin module
MAYYPMVPLRKGELRKEGLLEGPNKSWFDNGKLKSESTYVKGEPEGK